MRQRLIWLALGMLASLAVSACGQNALLSPPRGGFTDSAGPAPDALSVQKIVAQLGFNGSSFYFLSNPCGKVTFGKGPIYTATSTGPIALSHTLSIPPRCGKLIAAGTVLYVGAYLVKHGKFASKAADVAGPANPSHAPWQFPLPSNLLTLKAGHHYAFVIVTSTAPPTPTPSPSPTTSSSPLAGYVYVASNASVVVFPPGTAAPKLQIAGNNAQAIAFDPSGNAYVAYTGSTVGVKEFAPETSTTVRTINTNIFNPVSMAFDSSGDLFVADDTNPGQVLEYAPGSTNVSATITSGVSVPDFVAVDGSNNLYVANAGSGGGSSSNTVTEYAPGNTNVELTISNQGNPKALAFGSNGNLYVLWAGSLFSGSSVTEYLPGTTTPILTMSTGLQDPQAMVVDSSNTVYVVNGSSGSGGGSVVEYAVNNANPVRTITTGLSSPRALALDPTGNLYVVNNGSGGSNAYSNSVSVYHSGAVTPFTTLNADLNSPLAIAISRQ